jgi:hypothetical protein
MHNVGSGDIFFIVLILGVIHGIMYLVTQARKRKSQAKDDSGSSTE